MKITQQLIAAASFASLLFAPLAQAQTTDSAEGNVELTVIGSGLLFRASDMNFGSVTPDGSAVSNLAVACAAGDSATGTPSASGAAVAAGDATCGVIKVTGGSGGNTYTLTVEVEDLTNGEHTIVPTFTVYDSSDGTTEIVGLETVTAAGTNPTPASSSRSIAAGAVDTYKLGGTALIAANQAIGVYTGTYIVTAVTE